MRLEQIREELLGMLGEKTDESVAYTELATMFAEHGRLERSWVRSQIKLLIEIGYLKDNADGTYRVITEVAFAEPKHTDVGGEVSWQR